VKSAASNVLTHVANHAAKKPARTTTVKSATTHRAVKVARKAEVRAAVNALPVVKAVAKAAVNAPLAKTTQRQQKACHST
jgi:putative effector of murein hydrolase